MSNMLANVLTYLDISNKRPIIFGHFLNMGKEPTGDGKKILDLIVEKGLNKIAFSDQVGISRQTLDTWIGKDELSYTKRKQLIDHFGLPEDYFAGRSDDPVLNELREIKARLLLLEADKSDRDNLLRALNASNQLVDDLREQIKKLS